MSNSHPNNNFVMQNPRSAAEVSLSVIHTLDGDKTCISIPWSPSSTIRLFNKLIMLIHSCRMVSKHGILFFWHPNQALKNKNIVRKVSNDVRASLSHVRLADTRSMGRPNRAADLRRKLSKSTKITNYNHRKIVISASETLYKLYCF